MRSVRSALAADLAELAALEELAWPSPRTSLALLLHPGAWAVTLFRLSSAAHRAGIRPLSRLLYLVGVVLLGCELTPGASVGPGLVVPHPTGTGFGNDTRLGARVRLHAGVRLGAGGLEVADQDGMPTIGDDVWLYPGAKVFGPLTIGDGARVGANAWVTRDVPAGAVVTGAPARRVREVRTSPPDRTQ